jgi:hypothetical protein
VEFRFDKGEVVGAAAKSCKKPAMCNVPIPDDFLRDDRNDTPLQTRKAP